MRAGRTHPEAHLMHRIGWLRAAVLGANDGIVSTASLIVGVAAAAESREAILLAGTAGLVAGAMSMAAGEYISVSSQADTEAADLTRERRELATQPEFELRELAGIYEARGLSAQLAAEVAQELTERDALGSHARDELGITEVATARPVQAALTSAATFAVGAVLPLLSVLAAPDGAVIPTVAIAALVALVVLGSSERAPAAPTLGASLLATFRGRVPDVGSPLSVFEAKEKPLDTTDVPEPLKSLIDDLTQPDPARRLPSAQSVVEAIEKIWHPPAGSSFELPPRDQPEPFALEDISDLLEKPFGREDITGSPMKEALQPRFLNGRVAFRVPGQMWKEVAELVELRLAPRGVLDEAEIRMIEASFHRRGGSIRHEVLARIGSRMEAELLAEAAMFRIEALSSAAQDVDLKAATMLRWDWRVTPLRTGRSTIRLRLSLRRDAAGVAYDYDTAPFERTVEIRIRSVGTELRRFWRDNWKWGLTTGGGLGAAATLWGWVKGAD